MDIQKQIDVINCKLDAILKELGKVCVRKPEEYTLEDEPEETEEA